MTSPCKDCIEEHIVEKAYSMNCFADYCRSSLDDENPCRVEDCPEDCVFDARRHDLSLVRCDHWSRGDILESSGRDNQES